MGFYGPPIFPFGVNSCVWGPNYNGVGFGANPLWYGEAPCYGLFGMGLNNPSAYTNQGPGYNYVGPYDDSQVYPGDQSGGAAGAPPNNSAEQGEVNSAVRTNIQLYMKNGGVSPTIFYWMASGKLHYVTDNGLVMSVDADQLDLQRTIDENAKRGIKFTAPQQTPGAQPQP